MTPNNTSTTHSDLLTLLFVAPLLCILYSIVSVWLYDFSRGQNRREEYPVQVQWSEKFE